jgi:lipopolysaccharide export system protein LptA
MFNRNTPIALLTGLWLGLSAPFAAALPDDQQQPVHITADSAVQEANTVTYRGHVVIVQGSMHIDADLVVVHHVAGKLQRIVATGKPVHFQQQPEVNGSIIVGSASTLIYHHVEQRVELVQNALVDRDSSTVKGNRIEYLLPNKTVRAEGAVNSQNGQVEMVLQPAEVDPKAAANPAPDPATAPAPPPVSAPTPAPAPVPAPAAQPQGKKC